MLADFNRTQKEFIQTKREKEGIIFKKFWLSVKKEHLMKIEKKNRELPSSLWQIR